MQSSAKRSLLLCGLAALTLAACQPGTPTHTPSPIQATPDRVGALIAKAEAARHADDRETEALALREAVDLLGARGDIERLRAARAECVQAMVEAGGNAESYRLWTDLAQKDGAGEEATKMRERARKLMLQQAAELTDQVDLDLKERRPQAALCTAQASLELCRLAEADSVLLKRAEGALQKCESALSSIAASPTPSSTSGKSESPDADKSPPRATESPPSAD